MLLDVDPLFLFFLYPLTPKNLDFFHSQRPRAAADLVLPSRIHYDPKI